MVYQRQNDSIDLVEELMYNYADGTGDNGPVLKEFSSILNRYKRNYYEWEPFKSYNEESYGVNTAANKFLIISRLAAAAVVIIAAIIILMVIKPEWYFKVLFFILAGIALGKASETAGWGIFMSVVIGPLYLIFEFAIKGKLSVTVCMGLIIIFMIIYILSAIIDFFAIKSDLSKTHVSDQTKKEKLSKIEKELDEDRKKLTLLLPKLKIEYKMLIQQFCKKHRDDFTDEEIQKFYDELPESWWWMITPKELMSIEKQMDSEGPLSSPVLWSTECIVRNPDNAYKDAWKEYTPMYPTTKSLGLFSILSGSRKSSNDTPSYSTLIQSASKKAKPVFIDFITKHTSSDIKSNTIKYMDYKYDRGDIRNKDLMLLFTASATDRAYRNGELSDSDYHYLVSEIYDVSKDLSEKKNEMAEFTQTTYYELKTHTNIWTGQMLLLRDTSDNSNGFAIYDYRSQVYHVLKNINGLKDMNITRIYGSVRERNPLFIAKIHRICPNCR